MKKLLVRDNTEAVKVIGNFDSESKFIDAATGQETTVLKNFRTWIICTCYLRRRTGTYGSHIEGYCCQGKGI